MWVAEIGETEPVSVYYSSFFFISYPSCSKWVFAFVVHKLLFLTSLKALITLVLLWKLSAYLPSVLVWVVCVLRSGVSHPAPQPLSVVHLTSPVGSQQSTAVTGSRNMLRRVSSTPFECQTSPTVSWEESKEVRGIPKFCGYCSLWQQSESRRHESASIVWGADPAGMRAGHRERSGTCPGRCSIPALTVDYRENQSLQILLPGSSGDDWNTWSDLQGGIG